MNACAVCFALPLSQPDEIEPRGRFHEKKLGFVLVFDRGHAAPRPLACVLVEAFCDESAGVCGSEVMVVLDLRGNL